MIKNSTCFLFEEKAFKISKSDNNLFLISSSSKFFWESSWNLTIVSEITFCAISSCPGNFKISFEIKSHEWVIFSSFENFALISNNFNKIFWFAIIIKFSWLEKVKIFNNSIPIETNWILFVDSIINKSCLGQPALTKKLHVSFFSFVNVINVFIIVVNNFSSS